MKPAINFRFCICDYRLGTGDNKPLIKEELKGEVIAIITSSIKGAKQKILIK